MPTSRPAQLKPHSLAAIGRERPWRLVDYARDNLDHRNRDFNGKIGILNPTLDVAERQGWTIVRTMAVTNNKLGEVFGRTGQ